MRPWPPRPRLAAGAAPAPRQDPRALDTSLAVFLCVYAAMIVSGRGGTKAALPFGTFLAVGALLSAVAGQPIVDWYLAFYR